MGGEEGRKEGGGTKKGGKGWSREEEGWRGEMNEGREGWRTRNT